MGEGHTFQELSAIYAEDRLFRSGTVSESDKPKHTHGQHRQAALLYAVSGRRRISNFVPRVEMATSAIGGRFFSTKEACLPSAIFVGCEFGSQHVAVSLSDRYDPATAKRKRLTSGRWFGNPP